MSQSIDLKPGDTYTGSITIGNPSDATEDFHYKISLSPYSIASDGYEPDFVTMSDKSNIVNWTKLETETGTLKPNESKKINFTITVPETAPGGGQYLMIGVSSNSEVNSSDNGGALQDVMEMGSVVLANIDGEVTHEGKILENVTPGFITEGLPKTKVVISNTGNVHETATATITVKNVFTGQDAISTQNDDNVYRITVLPDSTRTVDRDIESLPQLGIFEVKQTISYLGEESSVSSTLIICPIWFIALVIATIASIIGMIIYGAHLRKKKRREFEE